MIAMSTPSDCWKLLTSRQSAGLLDPKTSMLANVRCKYSLETERQTVPSTAENEKEGMSTMNLAGRAVDALFQYQPFFRFAAARARNMIVQRGSEIGYPWSPALAKLRLHDWDAEMKQVLNPYVVYPAVAWKNSAAYVVIHTAAKYYLRPFHAYEKGNLSWDAAWEVELAAKSVHSTTFDPERKTLDPDGDDMLRNSYHEKMIPMLKTIPRAIVDIGCSTGLSTFGLRKFFPDALIAGVDLSPHFISVANFHLKEGNSKLVNFLHAAGEYTGLPSGAYDLVSMCLVCHELPRAATKQIIEEAHRLLKVGGALAIMEMNPYSIHLQSMVKNVFAFTAFKATEPYFDDYRTFSIESAIVERGFTVPTQTECSPRHRTIVAHKR